MQNGQTLTGGTAELPVTAPAMITRLPGVTQVQDTGTVTNVNAFRSPLIPAADTNALTVDATSLGLPATVGTSVAHGSYLNRATAGEPAAVLGAAAAQRLGIDKILPGERIWVGNTWFYLTGILNPAVLAPGIDSSVLVGYPAAQKYLHFNGHPTTIYLRAATAAVTRVDNLLAAQANPGNPGEVNVSQPSAALTAQVEAKGAFDTLFLGLGAVALLVGAVGVANIMIISVLERRSEIGLRRALGATRNHIRTQFLAEAILLAAGRRGRRGTSRGRRHRRLRPHQRLGHRHPAGGLGRWPGRDDSHRRRRRAAARSPRRPHVAHAGALVAMTPPRRDTVTHLARRYGSVRCSSL